MCGVGGLEHEDLAPLKKVAVDVPLTIPGRRKVDRELLAKWKLNDKAAVTVIIYDHTCKVVANFGFGDTRDLTRVRVKEIVKRFTSKTAK